MKKGLILTIAATTLLAVSCGKGGSPAKSGVDFSFSEAVAYYAELGLNNIKVSNYHCEDKEAERTFHDDFVESDGLLEARITKSDHAEMLTYVSALKKDGWSLSVDEYGDYAGWYMDTNAYIQVADWTLETYPSESNTYDCIRIFFGKEQKTSGLTEWPADYWAEYVTYYFESEVVVPEIEADEYELSSETVAVYCYFESDKPDGGYSAILSAAGWTVLDEMISGHYFAVSPDDKFALAYIYNTEYGSLDIFLANKPAPSYDVWPTEAIQDIFEENDGEYFDVPAFLAENAKFRPEAYVFWGFFLGVDVTITGATLAEINTWLTTLTTNDWEVTWDSEENSGQAKKIFADKGVASISLELEDDGTFVVTLIDGFDPIPVAEFPVEDIVNFYKDFDIDLEGSLPAFPAKDADTEFEASGDASSAKYRVYCYGVERAQYQAFLDALVDNEWVVTKETIVYNTSGDPESGVKYADYYFVFETGGEYDVQLYASDYLFSSSSYVSLTFSLITHVYQSNVFPVAKPVEFFEGFGVAGVQMANYEVAAEDASFKYSTSSDGSQFEVDVYNSNYDEMEDFADALELLGWSFTTDSYGDFYGVYGDTLATVYIGDYTAESQACIRVVFYMGNPKLTSIPKAEIREFFEVSDLPLADYALADEDAYMEANFSEANGTVTLFIFESSHTEMVAFASAMIQLGWGLTTDSYGDYEGYYGETDIGCYIGDYIGLSYDCIIVQFYLD